jgi:hypothetical protein
MANTEFCCRSGGSNLNAGTRTGNSTEPGTTADFTYASGNWVQGTGVFTVASGNPSSDGVAVGDFASVYADGSTVTGFVGRVTARDATTITVSLTAKSGTAPTDGTGNRTLKIGGAWQGPNGTSSFPFGFIENTLSNSSGHSPRVNFKNAANYDITAAMTHANAGPVYFQGYTTAYNDGGKATIDGGTSGASYTLLTNNGSGNIYEDLIFCNNGATGTAPGFSYTQTCFITRCVVHSVRGHGFTGGAILTSCEAYSCNQANSGSSGGFISTNSVYVRCIAYNNTGGNSSGFVTSIAASTSNRFFNCIAVGNGLHGFAIKGRADTQVLYNCDAYDNDGDGINCDVATSSGGNCLISNCNLVKNGGYGINDAEATLLHSIQINNCGFGSGTMANTSGDTNVALFGQVEGSVTYGADLTPWVDPDNGDFRITLSAAKNAGRGSFTQTASGQAGTIGYPDIGAAQHLDSGGGGGGIGPTFGRSSNGPSFKGLAA